MKLCLIIFFLNRNHSNQNLSTIFVLDHICINSNI